MSDHELKLNLSAVGRWIKANRFLSIVIVFWVVEYRLWHLGWSMPELFINKPANETTGREVLVIMSLFFWSIATAVVTGVWIHDQYWKSKRDAP